MRRLFSNFQVRLMLVVLLAVAPAIGLMLFTAAEERRMVAGDVEADAMRMARLVASRHATVLEGAHELLFALAHLPAVRKADGPACSSFFAELVTEHRLYANIGLARADGRLVASALPARTPIDLSDRAYFRQAVATRDFAMGDYQVGRVTGKATVNVGYPVLGADGSVRGVIFAALDLNWINRLVAVARLPAGAVLSVFDRRGTILARHPDARRWIGRGLPEAPVLRASLERRDGVVDCAGPDGVRRLNAFLPLTESRVPGVYVSVGFSQQAAFAEADRLFARSLMGLGLVAVLAMTLAWLGCNWFLLRRVKTLTAAADRVRGGDLSARTGLSHDEGEMGQLARAFDEMAASLEQRERERQRAIEALVESQDNFQAFMDNNPAVAFMKDEEGRMRYVNRPFEQFFHTTLEAVRDKSDFELWPPEVAYQMRAHDLSVLGQNRAMQVFETVPGPDGIARDWLVLKFPVNSSTGRRYLGGVAIDITERRKAEEALRDSEERFRQAQKMEAVGRLAGGVAHDFNNVLTAIMGHTQLMQRRLPPTDPAIRDAEEIQRAAARAASLTRQLLVFSRQQVLQPRVLDLNAVITEMHKMLHRLIGEDVELQTIPAEGLGRLKADPVQIEQVLMNLAVNARDAMPKGGKLTIETANVDLDQSYARTRPDVRPGPYVLLAVSDTGCGMDAATRARIFEPFFTTKGSGQGTGLGLSTVYGIVSQSGGHIEVYSEEGRGTTFKIYLPRLDEKAETLETHAARTPLARGSETILLVEDDGEVRAAIRRTLEEFGYTVVEVGGGAEALALCKRNDFLFDLLLTDVVMPQMSGPELVSQVATMRRGIKVMYLSGYTDQAIVHHDVLASAAFLQKPFTPEALARKVREVLDGPLSLAA